MNMINGNYLTTTSEPAAVKARTTQNAYFAMVLIAAAFLILCFSSFPASAQEDVPVTLTAVVDKNKVTIGDPITYTVRAIYDNGYHIEMKKAGSNLGEFEIKDFTKHPAEKLTDGRFQEVFEFVIAVYDIGSYEIPPTTVTYWKSEDEKDDLQTDKIKIEVASVQGEDAKDIQDIKPPLSVRPNFIRYILLGLAALALLVGAIILLVKILRKRKEAAKSGFIIPARREPPHVTALRKLSEIEAAGLPQKGEIKLYYIEISEVVRQYIGERFGIFTMERTSDEILRDLRTKNIQRDHMDMTSSFLIDSDMVKFAKYRPNIPICKDDMARAIKIIENTMEAAA